METMLLGGITTLISAETVTTGLSLDPFFVKTLAMLAQKKYENYRP
ncbi:hypothetical protein ACFLWG_03735 [Chloroflexota bacterium]